MWIGRFASFNQPTALAMTARSCEFYRWPDRMWATLAIRTRALAVQTPALAGLEQSLGASGQQDWHARFRQRHVNPITGEGQEFLGILRVDWDQAPWGDLADQVREFRAADMA